MKAVSFLKFSYCLSFSKLFSLTKVPKDPPEVPAPACA
jgi:hypothetical protein